MSKHTDFNKGVVATKSKKQLLLELLELEDEGLGDSVEPIVTKTEEPVVENESINDKDNDEEKVVEKPKKKLTEKQLEALKKGQDKRNENRVKNKLAREKKEEEDRKILEDKLVQKAIAIKKKQIKKQAVLDEISDDETPLEKVKVIAEKITDTNGSGVALGVKKPSVPLFKFF